MKKLASVFRRYDDTSVPEWMEAFAEEMEKRDKMTAVDRAKERQNQANFQQQINSILNRVVRSPYSSVDEAVEDLQKRTGFAEYRVKSAAAKILGNIEKKTLKSESQQQIPELLQSFPGIENYIHNLIQTNPGIQVPAVLYSILETFRKRGISEADVDDPKLARYVAEVVDQYSPVDMSDVNYDIGRGVGTKYESPGYRDTNTNFWSGLMPNISNF